MIDKLVRFRNEMLEFILILLLLASIVYFVYANSVKQFSKLNTSSKGFPGPDGMPLFGNTFDLLSVDGEYENC